MPPKAWADIVDDEDDTLPPLPMTTSTPPTAIPPVSAIGGDDGFKPVVARRSSHRKWSKQTILPPSESDAQAKVAQTKLKPREVKAEATVPAAKTGDDKPKDGGGGDVDGSLEPGAAVDVPMAAVDVRDKASISRLEALTGDNRYDRFAAIKTMRSTTSITRSAPKPEVKTGAAIGAADTNVERRVKQLKWWQKFDAHVDAVVDLPYGTCQYFLSPNGCTHGDKCKFIHEQDALDKMKAAGLYLCVTHAKKCGRLYAAEGSQFPKCLHCISEYTSSRSNWNH